MLIDDFSVPGSAQAFPPPPAPGNVPAARPPSPQQQGGEIQLPHDLVAHDYKSTALPHSASPFGPSSSTVSPIESIVPSPSSAPGVAQLAHQAGIHSGTSGSTTSAAAAAAAASSHASFRPLNVKDALTYLDQVKGQFGDSPEVYNRFLEIMKDFKAQNIDTPGVIQRVSTLFRGYPSLVIGFNTFLPPGYKIEPTNNPLEPVRVTTPADVPPVNLNMGPLPPGTTPSNYFHQLGNTFNTAMNIQCNKMAGAATAASSTSTGFAQSGNAPGSNTISPVGGSGATVPSSIPPPPPPPPVPHTYEMSGPLGSFGQQQGGNSGAGPLGSGGQGNRDRRQPVEFNHAINYVNKIKASNWIIRSNRFVNDPDTYKQFLEILQTYQREQKPIQEVYAQVQVLFHNATDLLDEFKQFLPDNSHKTGNGVALQTMSNGMAAAAVARAGDKKGALSSNAARKGQKRGSSAIGPSGVAGSNSIGPGGSSSNAYSINSNMPAKKKVKTLGSMKGDKPGVIEELEFFDRCKRTINNKGTYNEFLKVLNLYSQEIVDAKTLIQRIEPFLSKSPDLIEWFKRFIKFEEEIDIVNEPAERPSFELEKCRQVGKSYYLLPKDWERPVCTGRDDIAKEVLNDDWVSHPKIESEGGFNAHRKTAHEEALFKCEDERYEFDLNIDANLHTIQLLEPIAKKISTMTHEEKTKFKLPANLGGTSSTIYKTIIRKIYDKERGDEVIEALQNNPAVAVPVVLRRLKQKDEEWKRAQREWNKVWREIDARNYYRSLDHQGVNFKAVDKRATAPKQLLHDIEAAYLEQRKKQPSGPRRYQMDFLFRDPDVLRDARRIIAWMMKNQGLLGDDDEDKATSFLRVFIRRFFFVDHMEDDDDLYDEEDDDDDDDDETGSLSPNGARGATHVDSDSDGEDEVRSESSSAKGGGSRRATTMSTVSYAQLGEQILPMSNDMLMANGMNSGLAPNLKRRQTYVFYGNAGFYVFFRQYQMLYSRLYKMKELSKQLAEGPPHHDKANPTAVELGLQQPTAFGEGGKNRDRYGELLTYLRDLIFSRMDYNEYEEKTRMLFGTSAYLLFTADKLAASIVKQIQSVTTDALFGDFMRWYYEDREKPTTSARQEAAYRMKAEMIMEGENLFRLEYLPLERVHTIQMLAQGDQIEDDSITPEEKWSVYVDNYASLSSVMDGTRLKRREPFLKRTLPSPASISAPREKGKGVDVTMDEVRVESKSGLEFKICQNTYKIFFIEHSEDYFRRVWPARTVESRAAQEILQRKRRHEKWRAWLEGAGGWKRGVESAEEAEGRTKEWMEGARVVVKSGTSARKVVGLGIQKEGVNCIEYRFVDVRTGNEATAMEL
ncbi:hypothetical protein BJ742DRAFT_686639 [Cladochytrium replicatum]|nr:hypothetical protein BJ742DRAFT_686639 [Cladochytrium replicatum]